MWDLERHRWPRYCEETVWHLCGDLPDEVAEARAVVISNATRSVAVWCQREAGDDPVVWDYHVILLARTAMGWQVADLDSALPCPTPAGVYLERAFPPLADEAARYRPHFRVIDAGEYRSILCSDRSHMRRADGSWLSPPPPRAGIGSGTNLMRFVDMECAFVGEVCDLAALRTFLGLAAR